MWQVKSFQEFLVLKFAYTLIIIGGLIECVESILQEEEGKVAQTKKLSDKE